MTQDANRENLGPKHYILTYYIVFILYYIISYNGVADSTP